jgi:hypothetical protein
MEHMDQQPGPLACKACDGLGVRIVLQGGYLATCERCEGTGEAETVIAPPDGEYGLTTGSGELTIFDCRLPTLDC